MYIKENILGGGRSGGNTRTHTYIHGYDSDFPLSSVNAWWPALVLMASTPAYSPGVVGKKWTGKRAHWRLLEVKEEKGREREREREREKELIILLISAFENSSHCTTIQTYPNSKLWWSTLNGGTGLITSNWYLCGPLLQTLTFTVDFDPTLVGGNTTLSSLI